MHEPFSVENFKIIPYLMDHSAFDAAALEISDGEKIILYTGDFRGHGRKSSCLNNFIRQAAKNADLLLTEGTMFGRLNDKILTESELEEKLISIIKGYEWPVLFQASGQNIDRLVSFYKAARKSGKLLVIDIYTANVLRELSQLGNKLPHPSYKDIRVFYPFRLTRKIFKEIGSKYAFLFAPFRISREELNKKQHKIVMMVRPSMQFDLTRAGLQNGLFIYSMWRGYRNGESQKKFEDYFIQNGFDIKEVHTSGHASITDIQRVINGLKPKQITPIHTMTPNTFGGLSDNVIFRRDGKPFSI